MFASSRVRTISSTSGALERHDRLDDVLDAREHVVLERARRRDDPVARGDALHRRAQVAPRRLLDAGGDLGAEAAGERPLLGRHERARARDRLEHGVELHRHELRERDHLAEDLVLQDELGDGVEDDREHPAVRDHGRRALGEVGRGEGQRRIRVAALAHGELADVAVLGPADRPAVQELVLDEEHRALVLDAAASSAPTSWHSLAATTQMFGIPSRSFSSDWLCVGP